VTKFLACLAIIAVGWIGGSWLTMVTVGVIHSVWIPQLPTLGFPTALLIGAIQSAFGGFKGAMSGLVKAVLK
jgi:hypothetical protein